MSGCPIIYQASVSTFWSVLLTLTSQPQPSNSFVVLIDMKIVDRPWSPDDQIKAPQVIPLSGVSTQINSTKC